MNLLRYQWKLVVFSRTLKSCLQSPLPVIPALPSDNIAGQSHSISHHISLGWIIKTHSQLWKSPVLSNLKLPSHMEGRPPPTMPPNLLCEREGGDSFSPLLTPPGSGEGDRGEGYLEERQQESFWPAGALWRLLPAISVLCCDRHPYAAGKGSGGGFGGRPPGSLSILAEGLCSPADLPLPTALASPLRIHPMALALCWRVLTGSLNASCYAFILREAQRSRHECDGYGTGPPWWCANRKWLCFVSQPCYGQTPFPGPWWFCGRFNSFSVIDYKNKPQQM